MVLKITSVMFLGMLPVLAFTQDKIEADRPNESQNASLVEKGSFQAEIGLRKDQQNDKDYNVQQPSAVFRYGVYDKFEVRLETFMETQRYHSKNSFSKGIRPVEVGIKANMFQAKDTSFTTTLYGIVGLPRLASYDHRHNDTFYRLRLLFENDLSKKVKLTYNLGRDWDSDERQQNWIYTFSPQFQLTEKWDVFLEGFGYLHKNSKPEHYIDGGLAYYIENNLSIDINLGKGLSSKSADYFMTTGISFKL